MLYNGEKKLRKSGWWHESNSFYKVAWLEYMECYEIHCIIMLDVKKINMELILFHVPIFLFILLVCFPGSVRIHGSTFWNTFLDWFHNPFKYIYNCWTVQSVHITSNTLMKQALYAKLKKSFAKDLSTIKILRDHA